MKRYLILTLVLTLTCFIFGEPCVEAKDLNLHKGFTLAVAPLGVGIGYHPDQESSPVFSLSSAIRAGYGLNEKFIVFAEGMTNFGPVFTDNLDAKAVWLASFTVGLQYFPMTDIAFFVTPKAGLGFASVWNEGSTADDDREGVGFTGGVGAGYEWRIGERFAISPELRLDYYNIDRANAIFSGVALNLQWY